MLTRWELLQKDLLDAIDNEYSTTVRLLSNVVSIIREKANNSVITNDLVDQVLLKEKQRLTNLAYQYFYPKTPHLKLWVDLATDKLVFDAYYHHYGMYIRKKCKENE